MGREAGSLPVCAGTYACESMTDNSVLMCEAGAAAVIAAAGPLGTSAAAVCVYTLCGGRHVYFAL